MQPMSADCRSKTVPQMCIIVVAWHVLPVDFCEQCMASLGSYGQLWLNMSYLHLFTSFYNWRMLEASVFYDCVVKTANFVWDHGSSMIVTAVAMWLSWPQRERASGGNGGCQGSTSELAYVARNHAIICHPCHCDAFRHLWHFLDPPKKLTTEIPLQGLHCEERSFP